MLEASGFDFRNRHPQECLVKLLKHYSYQKTDAVVKLAYQISLDLYRTWAPLKQTTAAMAYACLELAGRLQGEENEFVWRGTDYGKWGIERGMVMESLLDLLELYTHHRSQTVIGPDFPVDRFLEVRIPLNQESEEKNIPRYCAWVEREGQEANGVNGTNGAKSMNVSPRDVASPRRASANSGAGAAGGTPGSGASGMATAVRQRVGERGREGTVRFILNPDRERDEQAVIELFSRP
jgi:CTD kinase subunit beta